MKQLKIFVISIALAIFSFSPTVVLADDELDVTMEVLDSVADIDGEMLEMRGPEADDFADSDETSGEGADLPNEESREEEEQAEQAANDYFAEEQARENDFEGDEDFRSDPDEANFENESRFDDGEDIDDDAPDEIEEPEDNMEHET